MRKRIERKVGDGKPSGAQLIREVTKKTPCSATCTVSNWKTKNFLIINSYVCPLSPLKSLYSQSNIICQNRFDLGRDRIETFYRALHSLSFNVTFYFSEVILPCILLSGRSLSFKQRKPPCRFLPATTRPRPALWPPQTVDQAD